MARGPQPQQAHVQWQQGCALFKQGDVAAACRRFEKAAQLQPREPLYWLNLARAQLRQERLADAAHSAQRALALQPANELACSLAAHCLLRLERFAEMAALLDGYPPQAPRDLQFHLLHGQALAALQRPVDAIQAYMRALAIQPDTVMAYARMGFCFTELGLREEAAQCFRTAQVLGAGEQELNLLTMLVFREREVCRWGQGGDDAALLLQGVAALRDDSAVALSPFVLLALTDDAQLQLRAARAYMRHHAAGVQPLPAPAAIAPRQPGRPLRIGYLSSDFFQHATTILMAGMLEAHDRQRFEVTLYSHSLDDASPMRERVLRAAERFVDVSSLDDKAAAQRIRDDGIDILVDLKGFTRDARPGLMAHRPAPVQVAFLGYPGTTGAPWIDYLVGDPVVTPLADAADFSECIAQLPGCYQPNDSRRPLPAAVGRAEAGLPPEALVLCGFTQPYKISPEVLDAWCQALHALPGAVLWLLEWNEQVRKNLMPELLRRGIAAPRVVWAPLLPYERHLARLQQADLFLDTWPCTGHTTASDALWAGVPVLTVRGRSFAARVAASLNRALGLDALTFDTPEALVAQAVALGRDAPARERLRTHLAAQRAGAALFDSARFARELEALYERMAARSAAGLAPAPLPVQA